MMTGLLESRVCVCGPSGLFGYKSFKKVIKFPRWVFLVGVREPVSIPHGFLSFLA